MIEAPLYRYDVVQRDAARAEAMEAYNLVQVVYRNHPAWAAATYYRGLESEYARNTTQARQSYALVTTEAPTSEFAPLAWFGLGETLFVWGNHIADAQRLFERAATFADSPIRPFAIVRSGECLESEGDRAAAEDHYRQVIGEFPDSEAATIASNRLSKPMTEPIR